MNEYFEIILAFLIIPFITAAGLWYALWRIVEWQHLKELKRRAKQQHYGWSNEYHKHRRND
jgi:hypothetical protein